MGRRYEHVLDLPPKEFGDSKGERKRRIVTPCFDRVHALPRHFNPVGQILLAPAPLGTQQAKSIFHQQPDPVSPNAILLAIPPMPRPKNQAIATQ